MRVKVGGKVHNPDDRSIIIMSTDGDKEDINNKTKNIYKCRQYNGDKYDVEYIRYWVDDLEGLIINDDGLTH